MFFQFCNILGTRFFGQKDSIIQKVNVYVKFRRTQIRKMQKLKKPMFEKDL